MKRIGIAVALLFGVGSLAAQAQQDDHARGRALYRQWCAGCHDPLSDQAPTMPATTLLAERYQGRVPGALVERGNLTVPYIELFVRRGAGFMPFFRKTELSDADLRELADYIVAEGRSHTR